MSKSTRKSDNRPEQEYKLAHCRAAIFINQGEKGPFFTVKLERRYQRPEDGQWEGSNSFGVLQLSNIISVAQQALSYVLEQEAKDA